MAFRAGAAKMLHLTSDENDDEHEAVNKVAKKIEKEVDSIEIDKHLQHWNQQLNLFKVREPYTTRASLKA